MNKQQWVYKYKRRHCISCTSTVLYNNVLMVLNTLYLFLPNAMYYTTTTVGFWYYCVLKERLNTDGKLKALNSS